MRKIHRRRRFILAAVLMSLLQPSTSWAMGERSRLDMETLVHVEQTLKQAAIASPRWHSKQEAIRRDIQDISYYLEEAIKASRAGRQAAMKEHAHQALSLLQRAVRHGHFRSDDVAAVLTVLQRLLPNPSV